MGDQPNGQAQPNIAQGADNVFNVAPAVPANTERRETQCLVTHNGETSKDGPIRQLCVRLRKLKSPVPTRVLLNGQDNELERNKDTEHNKQSFTKPRNNKEKNNTTKTQNLQRVHAMCLRPKQPVDYKGWHAMKIYNPRRSARKSIKPPVKPLIQSKSKNSKNNRRSRLISTQSSREDNIPLAHYPYKTWRCVTCDTPERRRVQPSSPKRSAGSLIAPLKPPIEPVAGPSGLQKAPKRHNLLPSPSTTPTPSTSTSSSPLLPRRTKHFKPTTIKVSSQTRTCGSNTNSGTLYTEPNNYRWMTGSLSPDGGREMVIENPDPLIINTDINTVCPVSPWTTVKELINASQTELDSRCTKCDNCIRIDNIMKLSKVVVDYVKVDMTDDEFTSTTTRINDSASSHNDYMYIELVPRNANSLMKLQYHEILGKRLLCACLIPRSHAPALTDYTLIEQENKLEKLNHSLRLIGNPKLYRRLIDSIMSNESNTIALDSDKISGIKHNEIKRQAKCRRLITAEERLIHIAALKAQLISDMNAKSNKGTNIATGQMKKQDEALLIKEVHADDNISGKIVNVASNKDNTSDNTGGVVCRIVNVIGNAVHLADEEDNCIKLASNKNNDTETLERQLSPQQEEDDGESSSDPGEGEYLQDENPQHTIVPVTLPGVPGPSHSGVRPNATSEDEVDALDRDLKLEEDAKDDEDSSDAVPVASGSLGPVPDTFPSTSESAKIVRAPVYFASWEEFKDPIVFIEKIWPRASQFGICKVIPPRGWKPPSTNNKDLRFNVSNQYVSRFLNRWGPASREMSAIRLCLLRQNVNVTRPPQVDGVEINLPRLYHSVQRFGGLENVIRKKRWGKVCEELHLNKTPATEQNLDQIYVEYLLPYATLTHQERQEILSKVESAWLKKNNKLLDRAMNPFYRQKKLLGELESSEEESEDEATKNALIGAEHCVVKGQNMDVATFKKVAANVFETHSGGMESNIITAEAKYWQHVIFGTDHLCVNAATINADDKGHGFPQYSEIDDHEDNFWNLKLYLMNPRNYLRYLGQVNGVTVPKLHFSMFYSTTCWHKNPHLLCWNQYMHEGVNKIWYGIPDSQSDNFRKAVETLAPTSCQNKPLWLSANITMIPPAVLREHNVSLCSLVQYPGELVIVFPKAYSSSFSIGFTKCESVYYAPKPWLDDISQVIQESRESCEPTLFSLEQLLIKMSKDPKIDLTDLKKIQPTLNKIITEEIRNRVKLQQLGLTFTYATDDSARRMLHMSTWNYEYQECDYCRASLYLSKVQGLTGKKSSLCLEHTLKLLSTNKYKRPNDTTVQVSIYITDRQLKDMAEKMKARLGSDSSRDTPPASAAAQTRPARGPGPSPWDQPQPSTSRQSAHLQVSGQTP